jgi:Xaa-Pro dipeptidase
MSIFEKKHFEDRLEKIRSAMRQENLDGLLVYSWKRGQVRYISGYHPNYVANVAVVVIPVSAPPAMWIRFGFDLERAQRQSWMEDIFSSGNMNSLALDTAAAIRDRISSNGRIGLVTGDGMMEEMPRTFFHTIKNELPDTNFTEAEHILQEVREIKSKTEFEALRHSAVVSDLGFQAALESLEPGCTEFDLVGTLEGTIRKQGCGEHLVVISSKGISDLIRPPQDRTLQAGDNVIIEAAVENNGYWAQTAQTFFVGEINQSQADIYRATYQAYRAGVSAAKPGNTCDDIANAAKISLEQAGYGNYIEQDYGHGIGLDLPEPPRIELNNHTLLKPGMVLVIHPALRLPGVGGAFIGGTVLIKETGAEMLHNIRSTP